MFRAIAEVASLFWLSYDDIRLYDRSLLGAVESDVQTVARVWFEHDAHESVNEFVSFLPMDYVGFVPHDQYTGSKTYETEQVFRMFVIARLDRIESETALVEILQERPELLAVIVLKGLSDQSMGEGPGTSTSLPDLVN